MAVLQCEDWSLLVHDPKIKAVVGVRPCHKEMVVDDVKGICCVFLVLVEQLGVLIHLPEDNLSVEADTDDSVFRISLQIEDVCVMSVVRVHVHHFSDIPYF